MFVILVAGRGQFLLMGMPFALIGIAALSALMLSAGMVSGYLFDRFRLLRALMPQVLFLALLVTPVLWHKDQLVRARWIAEANPLTHVLDIIRTPLLSGTMPWHSLAIVVLLACGFAFVAALLHEANRKLISFRWVA
jgi:ABC-type polysaccharide/polyol phosphate export permease